jgi:hypothetical protein
MSRRELLKKVIEALEGAVIEYVMLVIPYHSFIIVMRPNPDPDKVLAVGNS